MGLITLPYPILLSNIFQRSGFGLRGGLAIGNSTAEFAMKISEDPTGSSTFPLRANI